MGSAPHPNNRRIALAEEIVRDLHVTQALTLTRVAARLGVAATTVSRRLRDLGLQARPRGPTARPWLGGPGTTSFTWTSELAWIVGLIATDGNLSGNHRTVSVTSKDVDLLESVREFLALGNPIAP